MPTSVRSTDTEQVIERFRIGDAEAFEQLYAMHSAGVLSFLAARARPPLDYEMLAQDTWMRVWRARGSFDGRHFRGWLYQVARNLLKDEYRKLQPHSLPEDFELEEFVAEGLEEEWRAFQECVQAVGGDFVKVLVARLDGESTDEIAAQFKIKPATVFTRVSRAKELLADCVQKKLS